MKTANRKNTNQVRIIAGQWRGRKIHFENMDGLRPTSDRIRETLFSWLMPYIEQSHCLDLFAGSGALAIESLSRQALSVTLVDSNKKTTDCLESELQKLSAKNYSLMTIDAFRFIASRDFLCKPYNLIFLDPPYHLNILHRCIEALENTLLAYEIRYPILIYCEDRTALDTSQLPENWKIEKSKKAGQVYFYLIERLPLQSQ